MFILNAAVDKDVKIPDLQEFTDYFNERRIKGFANTCLNFTWESLEHANPGIYDEAFLAYMRKIMISADNAGIKILLNPYFKNWSHNTGGEGAPEWTFQKCSFLTDKMRGFFPQMNPDNTKNYNALMMYTLFLNGNRYLPDVNIEGLPVQDWLQDHYIAAIKHCLRRLKNCNALCGISVMNIGEPGFACEDGFNALTVRFTQSIREAGRSLSVFADGIPESEINKKI